MWRFLYLVSDAQAYGRSFSAYLMGELWPRVLVPTTPPPRPEDGLG